MTHLGHIPHSQQPAEEPSHVDLPRYVLVFRDNQPPKEHAFVAISDDAATELMRKQYPGFAWVLYHVGNGGREDCFYEHTCEPAPHAPPPWRGAHSDFTADGSARTV